MDTILRLLLWRDPGGAVTDLQFQPLLLAVLSLILVAGIWLIHAAYRRDAVWVDPVFRRRLAWLRCAALALALVMASGATIGIVRRFDGTGTVLVLLDRSRSMALSDTSGGPSRQATLAAVGDQLLHRLSKNRSVDLRGFGAAEPETLPPPLADLPSPVSPATRLGSALAAAGRSAQGRRIDAVVLLSDGGWNQGPDPLPAAQALGVPVIAVGVGQPQTRNLEVAFVGCDEVLIAGDRASVELRLRQRGCAGMGTTLRLNRIDADGSVSVLAEQPVVFTTAAEMPLTVAVAPGKPGPCTIAAELVPLPEEGNRIDNRRVRAGVRVVDRQLRVLVVEDAPRWDYRFLRAALEADPGRVRPGFLLRQGDPGGDPRALRSFPTDLSAWDCVVLGDVPPEVLGEAGVRALEAWVRAGGGLIAVAGRQAMPGSWAGTVLDRLLPVEVDAQPPPLPGDELVQAPAATLRPQPAIPWPALRFAAEPETDARLWAGASPWAWFQPVRSLKPGASALLTHPTRRAGDAAMPLMALQRYGRGQVAWLGSDESWRWRSNPGPAEHRRWWVQTVSALGMPHLLGDAGRIQVETDHDACTVGEPVAVTVRVLDAGAASSAGEVTAVLRGDHANEAVPLIAKPGQSGVYTGTWTPGAPGRMRLSASVGGETSAERLLSVEPPHLEEDDAGMREDLLRAIADASGGAFVPLQRISEVPDLIAARERHDVLRREELGLWNAPGVLLLFALLLGLEWWFRKRWDML